MLALALLTLGAGSTMAAENLSLVRALRAGSDSAGNPLGAKLYQWLYFRSEDKNIKFSQLARFIVENPGWPGMDGLKEKAERIMPAGLGSGEIISWFSVNPPLTAAGLDRYLEALLIAGKKGEGKKILGEWWASKLTTRDEQKTIYIRYGNLIDMNAHRRRLDTLLFSQQYTNARAIAGVLGKGYLQLAEARIALAEDKPGVNGLINKVPAHLQNDPGLMYERLRWRRKNNMNVEAMKILHEHPPLEKIQNPGDWWAEQHIIIRRLMEKHMYESAYLLATKHFQKDGVAYADAEWMAGWLALRFMKRAPEAYQRFEALYGKVETPISRSRAAYWAGRAAEGFGQKELAHSWYEKAAKFQTVFYGQLAGVKLGMAEALPNAAPPKLEAGDMAAFGHNDLVGVARLLQASGERALAGQFLEAFVEQEKTPKAYRYAAELAYDFGYYRTAVKIAKDATKEGMFLTAQSYPVITDRLRRVDVEWALVHAVIRQESMFDSGAVSPAGALGLMQLMPRTAAHTAKKAGLPQNTGALTANPEYNIRVGSAYMDELLERFDGSYPLAIAAYNAGPSRVREWLEVFGDPRTGKVDPIDWMEMISIPETRNYVQRVMEAVYVYRLRLKGIQKPPVHPIHIAMTTH